ncbi:hypothetical protein GCM10027048_09980 [Hymenobacter coalescens]
MGIVPEAALAHDFGLHHQRGRLRALGRVEGQQQAVGLLGGRPGLRPRGYRGPKEQRAKEERATNSSK